MNSNAISLSPMAVLAAITLLVPVVSEAAKPAPAAKVNAAPYLSQLTRIGGNLRDFQAMMDARMQDRGSNRSLNFKLRVAAKMPDSVRMDVVSSSNGMFRGWKFARVGSSARLYDPISERATSTDISKITGKQPIRMDIGIDMFAGIFRPQNFVVLSAAPTQLAGKSAVLLKMRPRPGFTSPKDVVKLSHILVWMDPARKAPLRQETYGWLPGSQPQPANLKRLLAAQFGGFQLSGPGLWYPTRVTMSRLEGRSDDEGPKKVLMKLARVNNVLVPTEMSVMGSGGSSVSRFTEIRVNTNIPDSTFYPRA